MGLFDRMKDNKYLKNMKTMATTNLSLLDTMIQTEDDYDKVKAENKLLKDEIVKLKTR